MSKGTGKEKSVAKGPVAADGLSFEEALAQVESIIDRIEAGEVGLEQSLVEYERGVGLINLCRTKLDRAQQQIEDLTRKLDGPGAPDDKSGPARVPRNDGPAVDQDPPF